ncbi:MAG: AMIN domain-containing protein [Gammaproteobacteria bacterium]|nr:AMIN domain-containing protein [Gammaproteobacteria bacterium]MYK46899.1 AMIN domain-containing protein [Gammaproteobacteria bacterium]
MLATGSRGRTWRFGLASRDWVGALKSPISANEGCPRRWPAFLSGTAVAVATTIASTAVAAPNQVEGIRLHDGPDSTRVVVSTADIATFKVFRLEDPNRLVVDLYDTRPARSFAVPVVDSRTVDRIRSSPRQRINYRIVLDLAHRADHRELVLGAAAAHPHRLVIDLYPVVEEGGRSSEATPPRRDRDVIVAVDPGHGGKDPGTGAGRVEEKHIVLAIAREMKRSLDQMPGFRTVLTRDGDYFLDLRRRFEIADRAGADMFVSIHANAFKRSSVSGAEVYVLSARGASRETARLMAERGEQPEIVGGFGSVSLHNVDESVARIVVDVSMDSKRNKSVKLGESVLGALAGTVTLRQEHLYERGFMVLRSPSLPSILVETGYLSNSRDRRILTDPAHQRRIAKAIVSGIRDYASMNAPEGTLLASMVESGTVRYVVKRGDTLSEIAERYGTSTRLLLLRNTIASSNRILVGQVLFIPFGKASGS